MLSLNSLRDWCCPLLSLAGCQVWPRAQPGLEFGGVAAGIAWVVFYLTTWSRLKEAVVDLTVAGMAWWYMFLLDELAAIMSGMIWRCAGPQSRTVLPW